MRDSDGKHRAPYGWTIIKKKEKSFQEDEKKIIEKCSDINKKGSYRIDEQMSNQFIKIYDQGNIKLGNYKKLKILLKISGIWSNNINKEFGLTFRFFVNDIIEY